MSHVRALWVHAPFVLRRHPAILAAVALTAALGAAFAAGSPFVRAGVRSESLRGQVRELSPLAAGLEIRSGGRVAGEAARRAAAVRFARDVVKTPPPVLTATAGMQLTGPSAEGVDVLAMTRTGALAHVDHKASAGGDGVWISSSTAELAGLRPGSHVVLSAPSFVGEPGVPRVRLRVAGVYRDLGSNVDDPYWANFVQDIRAANPDAPPPAAFVLMDERTFVRTARRLTPFVGDRFEFPVDTSSATYTSATQLDHAFDRVRRLVARGHDARVRALGCGVDRLRCTATSALSSALAVAARNVAAVEPTISLLSAAGLAVALVLSVAAGVFLVRRRSDEARLSLARGEAPSVFAARAGIEALLPAAIGAAAGLAAALLALAAFAVEGSIDRTTVVDGALRAAGAAIATLVAVAVGVWIVVPRVGRHAWLAAIRRVPWEVVPVLAAAAAVALASGGGLAHDENGYAHPTLAVFALPLVVAAVLAGIAVRATRFALARPVSRVPPPLFLALKRLAAARGLFLAVIVATAVAFAAFAFAETLSASLGRSVAIKAYLNNGSDVQGFINPPKDVTAPFPFPVALVQVDTGNVTLADGTSVDVIAGGPAVLRRTLRWGDGWPGDPRRLLPRLNAPGPPLPVLATPGTPSSDAVVDQGARIAVRIVGRTDFPGTTADRAALIVSTRAFARAAARAGVADPAPGTLGLLWAKGLPREVIPRLNASPLYPAYLTTIAHIEEDGSVVATRRSFRYVRAIGAAAAALSLLGLLLYLQARQQGQRIESALTRRMGLGAVGDAVALAVEGAFAVAVGVVTGAAAALLTAPELVDRVDPLPAYPPPIAEVIPWTTLLVAAGVAVCIAALFGALAAAIAARSDVAEVLRVA